MSKCVFRLEENRRTGSRLCLETDRDTLHNSRRPSESKWLPGRYAGTGFQVDARAMVSPLCRRFFGVRAQLCPSREGSQLCGIGRPTGAMRVISRSRRLVSFFWICLLDAVLSPSVPFFQVFSTSVRLATRETSPTDPDSEETTAFRRRGLGPPQTLLDGDVLALW